MENPVIQPFATNRAHRTLRKRIPPRRPKGDDDLLVAHVLDAFSGILAVGAITVTNQKARRLVVGEGLDDLLGCPACSRVRRDIEVNDAT